MNTPSILRLNLLRVFYLVLVIGIGLEMHVWSKMIYRVYSMQLDSGTVICMLFALSVLSILGLRYPLKMLPVLFWELTWKASWLLSVALPHWLRGQWNRDLGIMTFDVGMIVVFVPLVPWSYVFEHFVKRPGNPWLRHPTATPVDA
jgi:hypothetical protein